VPEFSLIEKLQQSRLDIALNPRELPTLEIPRYMNLLLCTEGPLLPLRVEGQATLKMEYKID
jgi:hypothetical protein